MKLQSGDRHSRCGVATHRFEQDRTRGDSNLMKLFTNDKAVIVIGDQNRCGKALRIGDSQHSLLEEAALGEERQ